MAERLYRSRDDRMLAGVAAGVAETLDADPSLVRIAWALLAIFTGGIAVVVYIVMAIVVPEAPDDWRPAAAPSAPPASSGAPTEFDAPGAAAAAPGPPGSTPAGTPTPSYWAGSREERRAARRARRDAREPGRGGLVIGLVLVVIGGVFLLREFVPWFDWHVWWPVGLIVVGALFLIFALRPDRPAE
jgi:phage shock protein PspC (stress-responsive transcriptional regulator)